MIVAANFVSQPFDLTLRIRGHDSRSGNPRAGAAMPGPPRAARLRAALGGRDQADELRRVVSGVAELMHLIGRHEDDVPGLERSISLFAAGDPAPRQDKDLMLIIVTVPNGTLL